MAATQHGAHHADNDAGAFATNICATINNTFSGSIDMASLNRESSMHAAAEELSDLY